MDKIKNLLMEVDIQKSNGDFKKAERLIEEGIVKYTDDHRLYEELGDINLYIGNHKKASNAIDFALKLNNESPTGNYLKGFCLLSKNKVEDAIQYLEKSNKLMGNNSEVLRNLGWAYTMTGEVNKGISILKRALIIAPQDELIKEDLAMALIGSGDFEKGNSILKEIRQTVQNQNF